MSDQSISPSGSHGDSPAFTGLAIAIIVLGVIVVVKIIVAVPLCYMRARGKRSADLESKFLATTMGKFLNNMDREKPIRFCSQQLGVATEKFSHFLGAGGYGSVYRGCFENGTRVAVKILNGSSDKRIEEQFMAEVSTIGRVHHVNLLRLYGFCLEKNLKALVYEYMVNGSLERFLFQENRTLGYDQLYEISVGIAKGIAYLHEECHQIIIHYDIKPENILLDANFTPKVADFGLAKLCNRDITHITMTARKGTPGYAAPELWLPFPVTHKCDVYSFGMLLFEIIGRRRNTVPSLSESQEWFPKLVWNKFDTRQLMQLFEACEVEEEHREKLERMVKVALLCVQYKPQLRPVMSVVVKMLEGGLEIPTPVDPFQHLFEEPPRRDSLTSMSSINSRMDSVSRHDSIASMGSSSQNRQDLASRYHSLASTNSSQTRLYSARSQTLSGST